MSDYVIQNHIFIFFNVIIFFIWKIIMKFNQDR